MNLQTLKRELNRLHRLVEEWQSVDEISPIERDLVLSRLRELYAALNWGLDEEHQPVVEDAEESAPSEEPQPEPIAQEQEELVALDAAAFISLDALLEREEEPVIEEPIVEEAPAVEEPMVEDEPATEEIVEEKPALEPIEIEEPAEPIVEEEPVAEELIEESIEEVILEEQPEEPAIGEGKEVAQEPIKEPAPEPMQEPIEEPTPEPEPAPAPATKPTGHNLFGETEEEAHVRHRHKQRVIMSLYDTEPEPKPRRRETKLRIEHLIPPESSVRVVHSEPEVIEMSEEELIRPHRKKVITPTVETATPTTEPIPVVQAEEHPVKQPTKTEPIAETPSEEQTPAPTLAETIPSVQTLGEKLAAERAATTSTTELHREPITDLRRAVGINDKFLLIRDLFGGNGSLYEITIRRLNEFDNLDDCLIYIAEHFNWNPNSDGAQLMMELLERKFVG